MTTDECYKTLAAAIVGQAYDDYKEGLAVMVDVSERRWSKPARRKKAVLAEKMRSSVRRRYKVKKLDAEMTEMANRWYKYKVNELIDRAASAREWLLGDSLSLYTDIDGLAIIREAEHQTDLWACGRLPASETARIKRDAGIGRSKKREK